MKDLSQIQGRASGGCVGLWADDGETLQRWEQGRLQPGEEERRWSGPFYPRVRWEWELCFFCLTCSSPTPNLS